MSVSLEKKSYSKSTMNIIVVDETGKQMLNSKRINGHPMHQRTVDSVIEEVRAMIARGHQILTVTVNLITEDLKEQTCRLIPEKMYAQ